MKILVLVMAHESEDDVFNNYKRIWIEQSISLKNKNSLFDIKFLYSDKELVEDYVVKDNKLITKCDENYWFALLLKVLSGFDFFVKNNFDLVFKTNLSTIINFDKFLDYCQNLTKERKYIYDGVVGDYQDYQFCSGAGMLLNLESVKLVLNNKNLLDEKWTDDIFIGYVLNKLNKIQPNLGLMNRFDIVYENTFYTKEDILKNTHIRVKIRKNDLDIHHSNVVYKFLTE